MPPRRDRRSRFSVEPAILVVDDEETPRSIACRMVRSLGYEARSARDGREALRYLQQHPGEVRLVLTDLVMPYMDGAELAERARDLQPKLPVVLMSTKLEDDAAELLVGYPELPLLEKPFTIEALYRVLAQSLRPVPSTRGRRAGDRIRYRDRPRQPN
jgi:two-component system, cell cycle sensor histidine kinase and response regulator CckA